MTFRNRGDQPRQEWEPKGFVGILRRVGTVALYLLKLAGGALITVLFILIVCCFVFANALGDYLENDVLANVSYDLTDIDLDQTSFLYHVDDKGEIHEYQKIYTTTDRQWATIDEIPEDMIHAAISIEDKRFYEHQGVDWITTIKACANMFFGSNSTFGGSTITQQLIKNLTGDNSVTVQRKVEEIFRAFALEAKYDKDVVIEYYLNTIYLGGSCYGVKSAARYYFGKDLSKLTAAECASLISITNNPSLYNPYISERCKERNKTRQMNTLWTMYEEGWLTEEEYEEAKAQELVFTSVSADELEEEDDGDQVYSWFTELVMDDVAQALAEKDGAEWNSKTKSSYLEMIKRGGYHIYTTIDVDAQAAVDAIYTDMSQIPTTKSSQQLQSAIVIVDNKTGDIVAVAGAVGEKTRYDAFSHATDEGKQTGSAMKPLTVYGPAFEAEAISPATVLPDLPLYYNNGSGYPKNENRTYSISTSVYTGVLKSLNTIAVDTVDLIGTRYSFEFGKNAFRLNGLLEEKVTDSGRTLTDIGYSPLALGALTYGVTVRDMANGYATFPNDGQWREARTFTKVYDSEGNLVLDNTQDYEQILSQKATTYVNYCLRGVVTNGTAPYANLATTASAGKTGTTSNNQDRWFVGYTKYYTAAVWCGYKFPEAINLTGNGTNPAGRLWTKVMTRLHKNVSWKDLYSTSGMQQVTICLDCGGYATDACKADVRGNRSQSVWVYKEDAPEETCQCHILVDYCTTGNGVCNEYCHLSEGVTIASRGLVKYTQERVREIDKAGRVTGFTDDLIYLVDKNGNDAAFFGIDGNINKGLSVPYKVCTVHSEATIPAPEPEVPEVPEIPGGEIIPVEPTEPATPGEGNENDTLR